MATFLLFEFPRLKILGSGVILETWVPALHMRSNVSIKTPQDLINQ